MQHIWSNKWIKMVQGIGCLEGISDLNWEQVNVDFMEI